MRVNGLKSCRRPVVSLSYASKSYRVNQPLGSKGLIDNTYLYIIDLNHS